MADLFNLVRWCIYIPIAWMAVSLLDTLLVLGVRVAKTVHFDLTLFNVVVLILVASITLALLPLFFSAVFVIPGLCAQHICPQPRVGAPLLASALGMLGFYFLFSHWSVLGFWHVLYEVAFTLVVITGALSGARDPSG
jgi:hypothetical protein